MNGLAWLFIRGVCRARVQSITVWGWSELRSGLRLFIYLYNISLRSESNTQSLGRRVAVSEYLFTMYLLLEKVFVILVDQTQVSRSPKKRYLTYTFYPLSTGNDFMRHYSKAKWVLLNEDTIASRNVHWEISWKRKYIEFAMWYRLRWQFSIIWSGQTLTDGGRSNFKVTICPLKFTKVVSSHYRSLRLQDCFWPRRITSLFWLSPRILAGTKDTKSFWMSAYGDVRWPCG